VIVCQWAARGIEVKPSEVWERSIPDRIFHSKMLDEEVPTSSLHFRRTISAFAFQNPDLPTLRKTLYQSKHSDLPLPPKARASAKRTSLKERCDHLKLLQGYFEPDLDSMPFSYSDVDW